MNETRTFLMCEYRKQRPCNGNGSWEVSLGRRECVSRGCSFEEEQGEEDEDFGPDASMVFVGVNSECFEGCEYYEDGSPAMVERKWEVNEQFISNTLRGVMLFDDVVYVGYGRADEERKYECPHVVVASPQVDIDGIQDGQERETPRHAIDNNGLSAGEELVNDRAQKKKMDERPNKEGPRSWGDVGLFSTEVDV